jgi:hypothetical protein
VVIEIAAAAAWRQFWKRCRPIKPRHFGKPFMRKRQRISPKEKTWR